MKSSSTRRLSSFATSNLGFEQHESDEDGNERVYQGQLSGGAAYANSIRTTAAASTAAASPFSVSLSYTIPKRTSQSSRVMLTNGNSPREQDETMQKQDVQELRTALRASETAAVPKTSEVSGSRLGSTAQGGVAKGEADDELFPELMNKLRRRVELHVAPPSHTRSTVVATRNQSASTSTQQREQPTAAVVTSTASKNSIRYIPLELVLHILSYCNIQSICFFSQASRRCNVMASSPQLWRAISRGLRLDGAATADGPTARRLVREYVTSVRRELTETLHVEEGRLQRVEERIRERVREAPPFTAQFVEDSLLTQPRLSDLLERTQTQVAALDTEARQVQSLRLDLVHSIQANKQQIRNLQQCLDNMERTHKTSRDVDANYWLLARFEARICRLVLGDLPQLPLVIRRGTTSFSMMELLALQLARDELGAVVRTRWDSFKKVCPLHDGYFFLVDSVLAPSSGSDGGRGVEVPRESASTYALVKKLSEMSDGNLRNLIGR